MYQSCIHTDVCIHTTHIHGTTMKEKEVINVNESKTGYMGGDGGKKRKKGNDILSKMFNIHKGLIIIAIIIT